MNLEDIEIFLSTARTKNISKTATDMYMSQSTLSHRLITLEKELGITLFNRSKGKRIMELTQQGKDFISVAEQWIVLWNETKRIRDRGNRISFSIGAVASLSQHLFMPIYKRLQEHNEPSVDLSIKSVTSNSLYSSIENYEFDIGFAVMPSFHNSISSCAIFTENMVLVRFGGGKPGQPYFGEEVNPADLNPDNEVFLNFHPNYAHWRNCTWEGVSTPGIAANDTNLVIPFLQQPEAWVIMSMSVALSFAGQLPLTINRLKNPPPDRICYMLTHHLSRPSKQEVYTLFSDYLDELLKEAQEKGILTILPK